MSARPRAATVASSSDLTLARSQASTLTNVPSPPAAITTVAATAGDAAPVTVYGSAGGPYLVVWSARSARIASPLTLGTNSLTGGTTPSVTVAVALDALLQDILDRACAMVESALLPGEYAAYGAASVEVVRSEAYRTTYMRLPAHQHGSVSLVVEVRRLTDTTGTTIDNDGTQSLLDTGEAAGVLMPSGCRMGICFGCVAPLRRGAVRDLRTGEVTTAAEGDGVVIQTCISAAAGACDIQL